MFASQNNQYTYCSNSVDPKRLKPIRISAIVTISATRGGCNNSQLDCANDTTYYSYDLRNLQLSETKALDVGTNRKHRYQYDAAGNLSRYLNAKGEVADYSYDDASRLVAIAYFSNVTAADAATPAPVKQVTYHYNNNNQMAGYTDSSSSETRTFTARGKLASVTTHFGSFSKTYSYTYTANGLIKTYTNPENITVSYGYNANNQISSVSIPGQGIISWGDFNWLSPGSMHYPGGSKTLWTQDGLLRQSHRQLQDPASNSLATAAYSYDAESNITAISTEQGDYNFGYDNLYRLSHSDTPVESVQYDYDGVGNRTKALNGGSTFAAYNANNQLQSYGGISYQYDANGHTIQKTGGSLHSVINYHYDVSQRLQQVDNGSSTLATYSYNPYGQRISKTTAAGTTYYLYTVQGLAGEYDSAGNLMVEYQFKPQSTWMTNPLYQRRASGEYFYYHNDHLGTPQKMVKANGQVVWQAQYGAFGEAFVGVALVENNLRFPGQYFDGESGLSYNYFRDYDAEVGRYLQSDPIGMNGGLNYYLYAAGGPLVNVDPTGEIVTVGSAAIGAVLGGICAGLQGQSVLGGMLTGAIGGLIPGPLGIAIGAAITQVANPSSCPVGTILGTVANNKVGNAASSNANNKSNNYKNKANKYPSSRGGYNKLAEKYARSAARKSGVFGCVASYAVGRFF